MGLLNEIAAKQTWEEFLSYKKSKGHLTGREINRLTEYIEKEEYRGLCEQLLAGSYHIALPLKKLVNKQNSPKKRIVYMFPEPEIWVLKLMSHLLYRYDGTFADNLYSFRSQFGAKRAILTLSHTLGIDEMYGYKIDVSNYFNSISIRKLLPILQEIMCDDVELYLFLETLLLEDRAYYEGEVTNEKRGVMAGCPIAPFLANVYLSRIDDMFLKRGNPYVRYSDDILVFAVTKEQREENIHLLNEALSESELEINSSKQMLLEPGDTWEFLGVAYKCGEIDLSNATVDKMKGKIRRKARTIYRWKVRKHVPDEVAMQTLIRVFNNKFFHAADVNDLTWSRWFFPLLTTDRSLNEIDTYLQQNIRYLVTGKHGKKNYVITYEQLKKCGYCSLVHEYWKGKEGVTKR